MNKFKSGDIVIALHEVGGYYGYRGVKKGEPYVVTECYNHTVGLVGILSHTFGVEFFMLEKNVTPLFRAIEFKHYD